MRGSTHSRGFARRKLYARPMYILAKRNKRVAEEEVTAMRERERDNYLCKSPVLRAGLSGFGRLGEREEKEEAEVVW